MALRRSFRRLALAFVAVPAFLMVSACSPPQTIFMKEVERRGPLPPAIHVDRFQFHKPKGPVDVLFVVDGTSAFERVTDSFLEQYEAFTRQVDADGKVDGQLGSVDYRIKFVTASGLASSVFAHPKEAIDLHIASVKFLLSLEDQRPIHPLVEAQQRLGQEPFVGRESVPVFVMFVLGQDSHELPAGFQEAVEGTRGFYKSHVFALTRKSAGKSEAGRICIDGQPYPETAHGFLGVLGNFKWRSRESFDLCSKDGGGWPKALIERIKEFRSRLILTHSPFDPSTMQMRAGNHAFRYGDDYHYDPDTHEIVFDRDANLVNGELLELSYYLEPRPEILSGNPNPAIPVPPLPPRVP